MVVTLHDRGLFTWPEWTAALSDALRAGETDGADYYQCWLVALETLIDRKLGTTGAERSALARAWGRAAAETPHGVPIRLDNDPQAGTRALRN
jgi:nitrile hydratase accessory protein